MDRNWLKTYLGFALELDSPILEAINENALKPVLLEGLDLYNYILELALTHGWQQRPTSWDAKYVVHLSKQNSFLAISSWGKGNISFSAYGNLPGLENPRWDAHGATYLLSNKKTPYDVWIKSLEAAILQ